MGSRDVPMYDCITLAQIGITNPTEQVILASILNGCTSISSDRTFPAFVSLARSLKRKATEFNQQQAQGAHHAPITPSNDSILLRQKQSEIDALKESLRLSQSQAHDLQLQHNVSLRELKELRLILQSKIKECNTLGNEVKVLEGCKRTLTSDITATTNRLESTPRAMASLQQAIVFFREIESIMKSAVSEIKTISETIEDDISTETHRLKRCIAILNEKSEQSAKKNSFKDSMSDEIAVCPIPTRDGRIVALSTILNQWKSFPSDNEGDINSTFRSHRHGAHTSIASSEHVHLVREIANDIGVSLTTPIQIQYTGCGDTWCDFMFYEQLGIFSRICKMIRCRSTNKPDNMIVNNGMHRLSIRLITADDSESAPIVIHLELLDISNNSAPPSFARVIVNDATVFPGVTFVSENMR